MTNFILLGLILVLFSSAIGGKMIGSGDLRVSHFIGMHGLQIFALRGV